MEAWMSLVGEYGFPIAVTFYLLHRIEKKLDQLNQSVLYLGKLVQLGSFSGQTSPPKGQWDPSLMENRTLVEEHPRPPYPLGEGRAID